MSSAAGRLPDEAGTTKVRSHRNAMTARPAQVRGELGLTDREMDLSRSQTWLRRRIFSTFSHVKPNRWFALLEVQEYKQRIDDFLSLSSARVLFVVCLQNGQLRPHVGTVAVSSSGQPTRSNYNTTTTPSSNAIMTKTADGSGALLPGIQINTEALRSDVSLSMGTLLYFLKRSGTHRKNNVLTSEAL